MAEIKFKEKKSEKNLNAKLKKVNIDQLILVFLLQLYRSHVVYIYPHDVLYINNTKIYLTT